MEVRSVVTIVPVIKNLMLFAIPVIGVIFDACKAKETSSNTKETPKIMSSIYFHGNCNR